MPGVFVGKGSKIGKGSIVHANVSLYDSVEIGQDCIIHSGTVIGSDGLGFAKDNNEWVKIEHLGKVQIGNNVEIGSNSTIDRGSIGDTVIGVNVKIDNQVHIAHNVTIGSGTAIAGNSAIAGSTKIGKNCIIGAKALITENKEIPDNSLVIGSPGKVVREVTEEEKKAVFENTKHYQDNWKKYSKSIF